MSACRNSSYYSLGGGVIGLLVGGILAGLRSGLTQYCVWGMKHLTEYNCSIPEINVSPWTSDAGGGTAIGCAEFSCAKQIEFDAAFTEVTHTTYIYIALVFSIAIAAGVLLGTGIGIYNHRYAMTLFAPSQSTRVPTQDENYQRLAVV